MKGTYNYTDPISLRGQPEKKIPNPIIHIYSMDLFLKLAAETEKPRIQGKKNLKPHKLS